QATLVVPDGAALGDVAVLLIRPPRLDELFAWDLEALADVVQDVKNLIAVRQVRDGIVIRRQYHPHASEEAFPIGGAMEIVHHEEAALQQILVQAPALLAAEGPALDLDR